RPEAAGQQVEDGCLAGAVRPDDAERLAGLKAQRDAVHGLHRAEGLGDVTKLDQRRHRARGQPIYRYGIGMSLPFFFSPGTRLLLTTWSSYLYLEPLRHCAPASR